MDLAIILGLCLDVSNSNPRDGLTNEQMTPYIARVLRQPGCNWMVREGAPCEINREHVSVAYIHTPSRYLV